MKKTKALRKERIMKIAFIFITATLILSGCTDGTDSNSKFSVIDNQETEEGAAKEDPEQEIPEEKIYHELEPLSEAMKKRIEDDYWELFLSNNPGILETVQPDIAWALKPRIQNYYGTYNGCVAVMFDGEIDFRAGEYTVNGYMHFYTYTIKIWRQGIFYELQKAYDSRLLGSEDLESIDYYLNEGKQVFYGLAPLSNEMEMQIREDRYNGILKKNPFTFTLPEHIEIIGYYGTYNNCAAVLFAGVTLAAGWSFIIEGVTFHYAERHTIKVWNEGDFYELQEAFDLGLLDREDLENIAYYWYKLSCVYTKR